MTTTPSPKYAKTLSGTVYSYPVKTSIEFLQRLSMDQCIPIEMLVLLPSVEELSSEEVYLVYCKSGLREWIKVEGLCKYSLYRNPNPDAIELLVDEASLTTYDRKLCRNPAAIRVIEKDLSKVDWVGISYNPAAIHILEANQDKIYWKKLSRNPAAIHLLEQNPDKIYWRELSLNPAAVCLLEQNIDKIHWPRFCSLTTAIPVVEQHLDKADWKSLSANPAAIHLLEANLDKINWICLSVNPAAIHLLEANLGRVDWRYLCNNVNGMELLKKCPKEFSYDFWSRLSTNPSAINLLKESGWAVCSSNPAIMYPRCELV